MTEHYTSDGDLVLFECQECGYVSLYLGRLHAHVETHREYTRFGIQTPFTDSSIANILELMDYTAVWRVGQVDGIIIEEIDNGP